MEESLARFAPVALTADRSRLDERQQAMARHLIEAGRYLDEIYLRQIWPGNPGLRGKLAVSTEPEDRLRLRLFELMGGPWDCFAEGRPFIGEQARPPGGGFYPEGFGPEEMEAWLERHPGDRPAFTSYFTVIRRQGDALEALPYHQVYRDWLEPAAEALNSAAALADHASLSEYLKLRAQALLDDDYFDSDCAWVALQDGPYELVFGPYEVYEDGLFGYKAAYQAVVAVRDHEESARFRDLVDHLPVLAAHLPVPQAYQGDVTGLASPIVVVDTVFSAGLMATVGIPVAFVLPNDRRVRTAVGTKKVMLKNICQAKFDHLVRPIAESLLDAEHVAALSFDTNFAHILLHEISHALGVQVITGPEGDPVPVHQPLRDLYSTIEECKAEVVGLYNVLFLAQEGVFPREWQEIVPATYLANIFRLTRRGLGGAHARANLLAFNFFWEAGAFCQDQGTGRFRADSRKLAVAARELSAILLRLEGEGNYEGAQALIQRHVRMPDFLSVAYTRLGDIPLDLAPTYPWAEELEV